MAFPSQTGFNKRSLGATPSSMGASEQRAAEKKEAVDRTTFNAATAWPAANPWWPESNTVDGGNPKANHLGCITTL